MIDGNKLLHFQYLSSCLLLPAQDSLGRPHTRKVSRICMKVFIWVVFKFIFFRLPVTLNHFYASFVFEDLMQGIELRRSLFVSYVGIGIEMSTIGNY
jgi:hypothetical protein